MNIIKIILSVIFFILSFIFIITGLVSFTVPETGAGWAIGFLIIGSLFLLAGIALIKRRKKPQYKIEKIEPIVEKPSYTLTEQDKEDAKKEYIEQLKQEMFQNIKVNASPLSVEISYGDNNNENKRKGRYIRKHVDDYVVIDIETTGLSPKINEILELSAIKINNNKINNIYSTLVKPNIEITSKITSINGITNEMVESAPKINDVLLTYLNFIGDSILLGHNVIFDIDFINHYSLECYNKPFVNDYIDTLTLSRNILPELKNHKLGTLANHFKIKTEGEHRGLADCKTTFNIYNKLRENIEQNVFLINHGTKLKTSKIKADTVNFNQDHSFYGKTIVFTGELEKMTRIEAAKTVANLGGINGDSITKKTNYLVLGNFDNVQSVKDGKSTKQKKAEEYISKGQDLHIINEYEFYKLIEE